MEERVGQLAREYVTVYESPDPENVYVYSPGIAVLPNGRLVATLDMSGPGIDGIPGEKRRIEGGKLWFGKVFVSDDLGRTWRHRTDFPFMHARPFTAGDSLYVLGHCHDLAIIRSDDGGDTWSEPVLLTQGQMWHQAPANVHYAKGNVYLVMERNVRSGGAGWPVADMAPVLMRGRTDADLTERSNWTFASELAFRDAVPEDELDYFGVPFYKVEPGKAAAVAPGRKCARMGWLETNIVQFTDPDHYFHDPDGRTFHLWMRSHTGGTGYAAVAKAVERDDGTIVTMLEKAPSGKTFAFVPCPGGHLKFHILFDERSRLYWLLGSQATDSMTRADRLPEDRYGLGKNERHRLQLHFSRNCVDWCFAGLVAVGDGPRQSRHYASMAIDGEDLLVLSRSGDERAKDAHNGNLITFHRIEHFRRLIY
ncbi:exo-alpha-sialidase [Paenibacillus mesophilus]|uniref:sialidase family protein n=1 Tax=Paenibacillus mesophilus TaxID=2582849 RepID=UPI00110DD0EF|nr:sialidase family protein [Paenibacillus mesophilus]TMV44696.1 exo-alpha-sialidase [Paenibacillus mesophilus]